MKHCGEKAKDRAMIELRQSLSPELLNRFDRVIVFSPLDINQLKNVAELLLTELKERMIDKGINIKWTDRYQCSSQTKPTSQEWVQDLLKDIYKIK